MMVVAEFAAVANKVKCATQLVRVSRSVKLNAPVRSAVMTVVVAVAVPATWGKAATHKVSVRTSVRPLAWTKSAVMTDAGEAVASVGKKQPATPVVNAS